jgi:hypothetical protein
MRVRSAGIPMLLINLPLVDGPTRDPSDSVGRLTGRR